MKKEEAANYSESVWFTFQKKIPKCFEICRNFLDNTQTSKDTCVRADFYFCSIRASSRYSIDLSANKK